MDELERLVASLVERLEAGVELREEPSIELKSKWPTGGEGPEAWEIADLVASMSNDSTLDGLRAIVYGPAIQLTRPSWLDDESKLRPKLLRHFDGGIVPRVELLRRALSSGEVIDVLAVIERDEPPYVTRLAVGGEWVVRVRTSTARRTATRAELLALSGRRRRPSPLRLLEARIDEPGGRGIRRLTVTNIGTVACNDVRASLPEGAEASWTGDSDGLSVLIADRLEPGARDAQRFFAGFDSMGGGQRSSFVITVHGTADDGEHVTNSTRASPNL
jgi:hypothetical protein